MDKKYKIVFLVAFAILIIDQLTKYFVLDLFEFGQSIHIITNVFHFTYISNTGSAFGLFKGMNVFFILLSVAVIIGIIHSIKKLKQWDKLMLFSLGLLLGGTLGNLTDRVIHGAVIDFIDFRIWPVFNIADSAISVGVILLVIILWKK